MHQSFLDTPWLVPMVSRNVRVCTTRVLWQPERVFKSIPLEEPPLELSPGVVDRLHLEHLRAVALAQLVYYGLCNLGHKVVDIVRELLPPLLQYCNHWIKCLLISPSLSFCSSILRSFVHLVIFISKWCWCFRTDGLSSLHGLPESLLV